MNPPPARLGRYRLVRRLAAGGMGEVFLAEAEGAANFTKRVAIKRILPHLARNEDFVRKFIDEANLMVQLHHGNIVPVLELTELEGSLCLVMEYLPGRDLRAVGKRLRQDDRQIPVDLAAWLVAEVLAGLDYAHHKHGEDGAELGVVHRDVSPSNICLGTGGEVKLTDFGIARARGGLHQSISGTLQGKFVYMSPEQADGRSLDARSDIFSSGLVLYELLTGQRPFEGDTETETLRRVRQCQIEPPSTFRSEIDAGLDGIVMKALAASPDDRYQTASDMRRALLHALALADSTADGRALAGFLKSLFPEGLVPSTSSAPSFDDALLMQLGSGPSVGLAQTRTASAPRTQTPAAMGLVAMETATPSGSGHPASPSAAPLNRLLDPPAASAAGGAGLVGSTDSSSMGGASMSSGSISTGSITTGSISTGAFHSGPVETGRLELTDSSAADLAPVQPDRRAPGRRRFVVLGLIIGLGLAGALALWPRKATVEPAFNPAGIAAHLELDGARLAEGARLDAGRTYTVCAVAEGYSPDCRTLSLKAGVNTPRFELVPRPSLDPIIEPAGLAGVRVTIDETEVAQLPFPLEAGQQYTVCAEAEGHDRACTLVVAAAGKVRPTLSLSPASAPPSADPALPRPEQPPQGAGGAGGADAPSGEGGADGEATADAGADAAAGTAGDAPAVPPVKAHRPRRRTVTLDARPVAEVWRGKVRLGATPREVPVGSRSVTYELRSKGYAPTPYTVTPRLRDKRITVHLRRWAYLTVRPNPPNSGVYINDRRIKAGLVKRHRLAPGEYQLAVRFEVDGRQLEHTRRVQLEAGQDLNLETIDLLASERKGATP